MLHKIISSIKEGTFLEKVKHTIIVKSRKLYIIIAKKKYKIDDKQIMFITFQGKYGCNQKAIAEEFIKRNKDYKLIWVIDKKEKNFDKYPKELKLVVKNSKEYYKELSKSKIIIQNAISTITSGYTKKEGQIMIQTWHGSLGFKRLDTNSNEGWKKKAIKLAKETDYIISNSTFENDVYRTSYWQNTEILEIGHPRNDILLDEKKYNKANEDVRNYYKIDKNTKIALYAPTFRDGLNNKTYDIDYERLIKSLEKRFGGKWIIMVRFHHKLRNVKFDNKLNSKIINATTYYDMQDLLCACDVGITDYSSWICDYVLTGKPGFLYAKDIEKYINERGFYYPLTETPFKISSTNEMLEKNILEFDEKKYTKDTKKFLKERGCFESGDASSKLIDFIQKC